MKRRRWWFTALSLALLGAGCAEQTSGTPDKVMTAVPTWAEVLRGWRDERSGHVSVEYKGGKKPVTLYSYKASWSDSPQTYHVVVDGGTLGKGEMLITDKALTEAGTAISIATAAKAGPPSLANLFLLTYDSLSPGGMLAAEPMSKTSTATAFEYRWTYGSGPTKRDYVCEIEQKSKRPIRVTISQVDWASPIEVTYAFSPSTLPPIKPGSATGASGTWEEAVAGSKTHELLRQAASFQVQPSTSEPQDAMTGRIDYWKKGFDVRTVKTWPALKGKIGKRPLPAAWAAPASIEDKDYIDPGSGKRIYEARAQFSDGEQKWRLSIQASDFAKQVYEMERKGGEVVKDLRGREFCFYGDPERMGYAHSISWVQDDMHFLIETSKGDRERMLKLASELAGK